MKKILVWFAFHLYLKRLIKANYEKRLNGSAPDEWYWADSLCTRYGFFVKRPKSN